MNKLRIAVVENVPTSEKSPHTLLCWIDEYHHIILTFSIGINYTQVFLFTVYPNNRTPEKQGTL